MNNNQGIQTSEQPAVNYGNMSTQVSQPSIASQAQPTAVSRRPQVLLEKISSGNGAHEAPRINLASSANAIANSNQTPLSAKINQIARQPVYVNQQILGVPGPNALQSDSTSPMNKTVYQDTSMLRTPNN